MSTPEYKAVFFDLDGTLLPMELSDFLNEYFTKLGEFTAKRGMDPEAFKKAMGASMHAMTHHEPGMLNGDAFWSTFAQTYPGWQPDMKDMVMEFYGEPFGSIGKAVTPNPAAARAVDTLTEKGYPLFLTTMPLFPRRAVEWRLAWAGVDPSRFQRITCYDNSSDVKPHAGYYQQNLDIIGLEPEHVLMVGNNTLDDLDCMKIGMDAFLVTDILMNPNDFDIDTVKHGSMADFADWVQTFPECEA